MAAAWDCKWAHTPCALCVLLGKKKSDSCRGWAVKSRLIDPGSTGSEARIAGEQGLLKGRPLPKPAFLFLSVLRARVHTCIHHMLLGFVRGSLFSLRQEAVFLVNPELLHS